MLPTIERIESRPFTVQSVEGINDLGTMSVIWGHHEEECYGRGLLPNDGSCTFKGKIRFWGLEPVIIPKRVVMSPQMRPQTDEGKWISGHEDPTREIYSHRSGLFCTQAYYVNGQEGRRHTNLLYVDLVLNQTETIATPESVMAAGLSNSYQSVDMVKEVQQWESDRILLEVGADGKSRIVIGNMTLDRVISDLRPCIDPDKYPGTWLSEHVSTAANPIRLGQGRWLLIFNGRQNKVWQVGYCILGRDGRVEQMGEPFITPPQDRGVGPDGQLIAFASDAMLLGHGRLGILWHFNDKEPWYTIARVEQD